MRYTHSNASPAVNCEVIVGTRPEAIKLAPVIKALREAGDDFLVRVVTSGQHGEICRSALATFGLTADSELDIAPISGSLADSAGNVLRAFGSRFADNAPNLILVQGDTTTAMAAALAGFYAQIPIVHVEAGLRSGNLAHPFPEEANRQIIDAVSEILLPPTRQARSNLQRAGFTLDRCPVTGNTVVDALQLLCATRPPVLDGSGVEEAELEGRRLILVTTHRRESWGNNLEAICSAIRAIVQRWANVVVALPVHPNPNVQGPVSQLLGGHSRIKLLPPIDYIPFLALMRRAYLILTDSGGVQEEAPSLGVPVLVLRKTTERPEAAEAGLARIIGTDRNAIVENVEELLEDEQAYRQMATATNPFGDGLASTRIVEVLRNWRAGRPLLAEDRSFSPLRPTTGPRDLQKRLPTTAQDIGLFSDAMRMGRTRWPNAVSATAKSIVP
jgi:UDP-N-acetylglucosamine 2-epimerase (non-hydrolysing)